MKLESNVRVFEEGKKPENPGENTVKYQLRIYNPILSTYDVR